MALELKPNFTPPKAIINTSNTVNFTKGQEIAVKGLKEFINSDYSDSNFTAALIGAGGTGKTFVMNYVISSCKYTNSVIACATPTHKAARVLSAALKGKNVDTIHSLFGFRLDLNLEDFDPNNPAFKPIGRAKLTDEHRVLIIDECSMLNSALINNVIIKHCKKHQMKLIFIGDNSQLAPVKENISYAFKVAQKKFELTEIVRQGATNPIINILSILREDIKNRTFNFINYISKYPKLYNERNEGYSVCNFNTFKNLVAFQFNDEEYTKNINMYRIIAYTNERVISWNNFIRNIIIRNANKTILTKHDLLMSYNSLVNEYNELIITNSEEYIIKDIVDSVDNVYLFKGFIVRLQLVHGGDVTQPIFVINHHDSFTLNMYVKVVAELKSIALSANSPANRTSAWKKYYEFKRKYLLLSNIKDINTNEIIATRDIDYGFAITADKAQGSTYQNVFVDMNDIVYDKYFHPRTNREEVLRRLYTACSRASNQLTICFG